MENDESSTWNQLKDDNPQNYRWSSFAWLHTNGLVL